MLQFFCKTWTSVTLFFCISALSYPPILQSQTLLRYTGKIGTSTSSRTLFLRLERKGTILNGAYWIDGKNIAIPVEGTVVDADVVLRERTESGSQFVVLSGSLLTSKLTASWRPFAGAPASTVIFTIDTSTTFSSNFTGTVNHRYRAAMKLQRNGSQLTGSYYYERIGIDIPLRGTITNKDNITLEELDASGVTQAVFTGRIDGSFSLVGTWKAQSATNAVPFLFALTNYTLTRTADSIYTGIVVVRSNEFNHTTANCSVEITYPQIEGMKNTTVQQRINKSLLPATKQITSYCSPKRGFEFSSGFTVDCLLDSVVAFTQSEYSSSEHAAHPNHRSVSKVFDLKTGSQLLLTNVITEVGINEIPSLIRSKLLEEYGDATTQTLSQAGFFSNTLVVSHETDFTVSEKGLTFLYDPYEISPYAMGDPTVLLTWVEILPYLQPSSRLYSFALRRLQ